MAEYRVFLLKIEKPQADAKLPPDVRLVQSTLDHLQYPFYYSVAPNEKISYIATWRCRGRTSDFKEYCPNPRNPASPGPAPEAKVESAKDQIPGPRPPSP